MDQAQALLQRDSQARPASQERQDQVGDQHHPDRGHEGVWRGFQEGLEPQGLFDGLEEQLNLPPLFVKRRHGCRGPVACSDPEHVMLAGFRVPVPHPSRHSGVGVALLPRQDHMVVRGQAALPIHLKALCHAEPSVDLLPRDEEIPVLGQNDSMGDLGSILNTWARMVLPWATARSLLCVEGVCTNTILPKGKARRAVAHSLAGPQ